MFKHIPSGVTFENRKQAILVMGHIRYKKALASKDFLFENNEDNIEDNGFTSTFK